MESGKCRKCGKELRLRMSKCMIIKCPHCGDEVRVSTGETVEVVITQEDVPAIIAAVGRFNRPGIYMGGRHYETKSDGPDDILDESE